MIPPRLQPSVAMSFAVGMGCSTEPPAKDTSTVQSAEVCDPVVFAPVGALTGEEAVEATAHTDTFGAAPTPFQVRYQWPDRDPSHSAAFLWRTDVDTLASQVQWGPSSTFPDGAKTTSGYTFLFGGVESNSGAYRMHEVRLCGTLQPDTEYSYRVGGSEAWSETWTFRTPPAPGTFDTYRVAIAGDSRGAYDTWGQILQQMEAAEPDFMLFSGDMVELGSSQDEWDAWFEAGEAIFPERVLLPTHGNHEFLAVHYFAQFVLPGASEEYFAVDYGDLLVMSVNDTVADDAMREVEERQFLETELQATTARWKVALHHQTAYSTCDNHSSNLDVREAWGDVFEDNGVELVFAGHNHIYERSVPIRNGAEQAPGEGTVYVVTGGAGAPLYTGVEPDWFGAVAEPIEHYVIADFSPGQVDVVAYDLAGNVIDRFTVPKL